MQLFSISYFPNIVTASLLLKSEDACIEQHESFIKQSFRSRCQILGPNDILTLSVPVKSGRKNIPIREIQVDNSQRWQDVHWRSVCAAYQKAPFFEYFEEHVKKVIYGRSDLLFDLSLASMQSIFDMIGRKFTCRFTEEFEKDMTSGHLDFRTILNQKNRENVPANFTAIPYQQNFGKLFVPNLSTLDLIFCEGPGAASIITQATD